MIAVFDCETRGLFGKIFRIGYYDGVIYQTFYSGMEFLKFLHDEERKLNNVNIIERKKEKVKKDTLYLYAFNLEFDFSKILQESVQAKNPVDIDFNSSLIISGNFHSMKFKDKNIVLKDIYPIVQSSLEEAAGSFNMRSFKKELGLSRTEKRTYFENVDKDDPVLLEYLKSDVFATYELVMELIQLSNLPDYEFVKCPTTAALSMRMFRINCPADMLFIKNSELRKNQEKFVRRGYFGGRTEVFKPELTGGYHYDINSLYPHVMETEYYPGDFCRVSRDDLEQEDYQIIIKNLNKLGHLYMIDCMVDVPFQNIPPLPVKIDSRLLFPVGVFSGVWTSPELNFAIDNCAVKILHVNKVYWWTRKEKVFEKFIKMQKEIKLNSEGGKKLFSKFMQNSLYGKFGMIRERVSYMEWSEEKQNKMRAEGKLCAKQITIVKPILKYLKLFFADYIRPQFSVFVTAYARVELLKMMLRHERAGNDIYYCDTDSLVTNRALPAEYIDDKEYGKWKLEREVEKGLFLLPKLYAEVDIKGVEVLKSKGIIKEYRDNITFKDYERYYINLKERVDVELYGEKGKRYYGRRKIIMALTLGKDLDEPILLKKKFIFSGLSIFKREFDFMTNTSKPITVNEMAYEKEVA